MSCTLQTAVIPPSKQNCTEIGELQISDSSYLSPLPEPKRPYNFLILNSMIKNSGGSRISHGERGQTPGPFTPISTYARNAHDENCLSVRRNWPVREPRSVTVSEKCHYAGDPGSIPSPSKSQWRVETLGSVSISHRPRCMWDDRNGAWPCMGGRVTPDLITMRWWLTWEDTHTKVGWVLRRIPGWEVKVWTAADV